MTGVVIGLPFDDVDGEQLERLFSGDGERTMRYAAHIDFGYTRLKGDWLAVGQHGCGTVDNAIGFFAGVRVQYTGRSGWDFNGTDNDIHVLAGQIALGQFGSLARLSVDIRWSDKADEASESNKGAYLVIVMPMLLRNDKLSHDAPPLINLDRGGGSNAARWNWRLK